MSSTTRSISVSRLKARLSEQLRKVRAGETVLITDRGRPIAMMSPLPPENLTEELAELIEGGLVRPSSATLPPGFWEQDRAADPDASVRRAILEEREEER